MSRAKRIREHYEPRIVPGRKNYDVLDWASATSQRARFTVLARSVELGGRSLLDVGCGLGDLLAFLTDRGIAVQYTGVDIVGKMVERAERKFPDARFIHADPFTEDPFGDERFDVVFCSGTFNLDLGNGREFMPGALKRLAGWAREYLVFNLLHVRAAGYGYCAYYDPAEVLPWVAPIAREVQVIDDYLPNDFTVICRLGDPVGPPGR